MPPGIFSNLFGGDTRQSNGATLDPRIVNSNYRMPETTTGGSASTVQGATGNDTLTDNFATVTEGLWQDPVRKEPQATQQPQQVAVTQQPQGQTFDDYVNTRNFHQVAAFDQAEMAKLQSGDTSPLVTRMQQMAKNTYSQAMHDAYTLFEKRAGSLVEDAVNRATNMRHGEQYVEDMYTKLKFTKDPAISPVAKTVLARYVGMGLDRDQAIEKVRIYFTGLSERAQAELNGGARVGGRPFNNGRSGGVQSPLGADDDTDWGAFMGAS